MRLQQLIEHYLAFKQALGPGYKSHAYILRAFNRAVGLRVNVGDVRAKQVDAFLAGAGPVTRTWHAKLSTLRTFYRFAISRGYVTTSPLPTVVPKLPFHFVPYIYTHEELCRLIQAADADQRRNTSLEPLTMRTILLLLYGTGLRLREAINLDCADVDLAEALLTIRNTKFGKTRWVPFGPVVGRALSRYVARARTPSAEAAFFTTRTGTRVTPDAIQHTFRILCARSGISRSDGGRYQPRLHDLRHSFAVHRLTEWYRRGADVQRLVHHLSVYLGHAHLADTQVYLTMTPELLGQAGAVFERYARGEGGHG